MIANNTSNAERPKTGGEWQVFAGQFQNLAVFQHYPLKYSVLCYDPSTDSAHRNHNITGTKPDFFNIRAPYMPMGGRDRISDTGAIVKVFPKWTTDD